MTSPVFDPKDNDARNLQWLKESADADSVRELLNQSLLQVMRTGCDLYLQRRGNASSLVFLGEERTEAQIDDDLVLPLIARLKLMASLDPAQTHHSQRGTIELSVLGAPVSVNVRFEPMLLGEEVFLEAVRGPKSTER